MTLKILLTNDDSHSSPLMPCVINALKKFGDLTIVLPKEEQSWRGKSVTRFDFLHIAEVVVGGHKAYTVDGTPADCINVGIYNIMKSKPDLVVSGINAGSNAGLSFVWSSGTVGACLEANIAGIPAVALSQCFDSATRIAYLTDYLLPAEVQTRLDHEIPQAIDRVFERLLGDQKSTSEPITWSINFPFTISEKTKFAMAKLGHTFYQACFKQEGEHLVHRISAYELDPSPDADAQLIKNDFATVTLLDMRTWGQMNDPKQRAIAETLTKDSGA